MCLGLLAAVDTVVLFILFDASAATAMLLVPEKNFSFLVGAAVDTLGSAALGTRTRQRDLGRLGLAAITALSRLGFGFRALARNGLFFLFFFRLDLALPCVGKRTVSLSLRASCSPFS